MSRKTREWAENVQARRKAAGKYGVAKAVRRWLGSKAVSGFAYNKSPHRSKVRTEIVVMEKGDMVRVTYKDDVKVHEEIIGVRPVAEAAKG